MPRDYYEVLNVPRDASLEEIKAAYRRLAREYHPDVRKDDPQAEERFKEINEAYQVLSDPQKRAEYDRLGRRGTPAPGPFDFRSPFEELFEAFFGGAAPRQERGPQRGADLRYDLEVTLEEAARGAERSVEVTRLETCPSCFGTGAERGGGLRECPSCAGSGQVRYSRRTAFGHFTQITTCPRCGGEGTILVNPCARCGGAGRVEAQRTVTVRVPPGAEDGTTLRVPEEGEAGVHGGPRGDLYVVLHLSRHPVFHRKGRDLYADLTVSMVQAALGDEVEVPTLDGPERVTLPAGVQPGEVLTLKGRGMPDLQGRRGDLHFRVRVEIPRQLTGEQRRLLLELARTMGLDVKPQRRKFSDRVKDLLS
ncbi:MAG: molecular chaperone DnaJ [Armatimonadota bacterium]|nr:molecular chaperone DnaJ [Armatimonadota bacterium]MDR5689315.1 molecular chaperone DnaJ [Armatimonadota bacterium]MDR7387902.1 molecular chaperone DnaJ [Armatimonadota bacterium]MDR7389696.1 molecular chaperone DnaJ [Armatimonadota bacterium]MDR7394666.1 molecular chaperone DnaJ [Armatimonadota bacterium]